MMSPRKYPHVSGAFYGILIFGLAIMAVFGGVTCTAVAGDLLRGGYTNGHNGSTAPGSFTPPSVAQAQQNANDVLARTTKAIQAVSAMQSAARKLAIIQGDNLGIPNPNNPTQNLPAVTEGLSTGGLYPVGGISNLPSGWTGVTSLTQAQSGGGTTVTVTQNKPDAVLTWQSFNVGKSTTLDFNQNAGGIDESKWVAFNIIEGSSVAPSQILGSINAGGQVYVINQNGIIFGGASQVNVHTLVASSLPIDTYYISNGLLNNPDSQFLFSALSQPAGSNGSPAFTPPVSNLPNGADGNVVVEAGADLYSPSNADSVGGRVALIGPNVTNNGTISTPDGQTILAAGLQVGFAASSNPSLRGLNTYVGAVASSAYSGPAAGTATNNGLIEVSEGDAMITGETVDQLSVIASTTGVSLNGRIDLLADYGAVSDPQPTVGGNSTLPPFLYKSTGTVVLGANSVNDILPELGNPATVVGTQLALPSAVMIQGQAVHLATDSTLLAPNATVTIDAGFWNSAGNFIFGSTTSSSPQIYLDSGAEIDVAGSSGIDESVTQNIIAVQLLGAELANDPAQRFGTLRGQTIYIDIREQGTYDGIPWIGTPLADTAGYVGLIESTVGELTIAGGTVNLDSGGSVVMQPGSSVNVSGGWINYQGGVVDTTKVLSGGLIYDISQATPDMVIQGVFTGQFTVEHPKYGLSSIYTDPIVDLSHYEEGYIYGGAGGAVSIQSPSVALNGQLIGNTVAGPRQLQLAPASSTLSLSFEENLGSSISLYTSPTPPTVIIEPSVTQAPADPFTLNSSGSPAPLRADELAQVILSPDLTTSDGFGVVSISNGDGKIEVPAGVSWNTPAAVFLNSSGVQQSNSISLSGANVIVDGSITIPDGSLSFTAYDISPFLAAALAANPQAGGSLTPDPARGNFVLGSSASLNTAGLVVDDRLGSPGANMQPLFYAGGSVSVQSYNANLEAGSVIDVSGGVEMQTSGKPVYGKAGSISILAGKDPNLPVIGGWLILDALLEGYSGSTGGSLSLQDSYVQIGGSAPNSQTLLLSPDFFDQGGFAAFSIGGIGSLGAQEAVEITPGSNIDSIAENFVLAPATQTGDSLILVPTLLPEQSRTPVSLTFKAPGVFDSFTQVQIAIGSIAEGQGASIQVDPEGAVSFNGNTVEILGSVIAPGGTISVGGAKDSRTIFIADPYAAVPTVELGPESVLSTAGTVIPTANNLGYDTGIVLGGGVITVSGNIVAERGALLDVSGISATLDRSPAYSDPADPSIGSLLGAAMVPTLVESNGGTISLTGGQELFTDATLSGFAGGSAALGGSLIISSGRFYPSGDSSPPLPTDITLTVTQSGLTIPALFYASGASAIGHPLLDKNGNPIQGQGYFSVDSFESSGMDSLTLNGGTGMVDFSGPVTITANRSLTVGNGGTISADAAVTLIAPYVDLGAAFLGPLSPTQVQTQVDSFFVDGQPYYVPPTYGAGSLTVMASLIDVGNLTLQGIGHVNLIADNGDIRGDGTLDVAGNILLRAGQIYPPTETTFTIVAYNYTDGGNNKDGSVTIEGSGERQLPLSAGGTLNIYASTINQGGVLRAPFGTINLGWNGVGASPLDPLSGAGYVTGRSVPIAQNINLTAGSVTSVSAVDPLTGQGIIIPYGINQNGNSWIDPSGINITSGGVPQKAINIAGLTVKDDAGAVIDISGGGDLFAYQFVSGVGGTVDILASNSSYAIIPGYQAAFAPDGAYNIAESTTSVPNPYNPNGTVSDYGYTNPTLAIGSQVYLAASAGLSAGIYTLLPARYALLPGAFLVTPLAGTLPSVSVVQPDGSTDVAGYRVNGLDAAQTGQPLAQSFEVDSQAVVLNRAEYLSSFGNSFLSYGASSNGQPIPRLPQDGGHLVIEATEALTVAGSLLASTPAGGLGAVVDISTSNPDGILIAGPGAGGGSGQLVLDASTLSKFNAGSLLIGGIRDGSAVDVTTSQIEVDNAGDPLTGPDIILAATGDITLDSGAEIEGSGAGSGGGDLTVHGNGALLRVSSDSALTVTRTGVTAGNTATLSIGDHSKISGGSVILDSSQSTTFGSNVSLSGQSVALDSGHIILDLSGAAPANGLVLSGQALQTLTTSAHSFSLLSYQSIDIYGSGQIGGAGLDNLGLHSGAINGFGDGDVTFTAKNILLDNVADTTVSAANGASGGSLEFDGSTITLGANQTNIGQYASATLNASGGVMAQASGGLDIDGSLTVVAPLITAAKGATETVDVSGALSIQAAAKSDAATVTPGSGASLTFVAASIDDNGDIALPAGDVTLQATAGDLVIGDQNASASINASGVAQKFFDVTKYTGGGEVSLIATLGNVEIDGGTVDVSAQNGGGDAGTLTVSAAQAFTLLGQLGGQAGAGGKGGSFSLDVGTLTDLQPIDTALNAAGFNQSLTFRVRDSASVTVDGVVNAASFQLSVDQGSIDVTGAIDADGATGGSVMLDAAGNLTLENGATISAVGQNFNSAGQGGAVSLETTGGMITISGGSTIDLRVTDAPSGAGALQDVTGTLFLEAPQIDAHGNIIAVNAATAGVDLDIAPIAGTITGASSIVVAGSYVLDAKKTGVASIDSMEAPALANASSFMKNAIAGNVINRLIAGNSSINPAAFDLEPGEEIENSKGGLILNNDWDLSTARYGSAEAVVDQNGNPLSDSNGNPIYSAAEPGILTLRAAGSITFHGSLSDGFGDGAGALDEPYDSNGYPALWLETLLPYLQNGSTIQAQRSWSYQVTAGADFTAANTGALLPAAGLASGQGSVLLGVNGGENISSSSTDDAAVDGHYQVIRTGAGSINISAAGNVELLNQFATVYTAGALVTDPTLGGNFDTPILYASYNHRGLPLTPLYPAQYSMGGGNVTIDAQGDIEHLTINNLGQVIPDSERELPDNWLYRRGDLASSGQFDTGRSGDAESTTWWVDFSNFFEGIGALGGGNVSLVAGGSIDNVDAVVPTNARMPKGTPDAGALVELGGGDVLVQAGQDINGGVYYVENGSGILDAGGSIITNSTRSPSVNILLNQPPTAPDTWLATTLFLGDGSFDVTARGDLLLGPVANPFLLPGGLCNSYWYKSYFSTYGLDDSVDVTSLGGDVTLREGVTLNSNSYEPALQAWYENELLAGNPGASASYYQPWLQINENDVLPFSTVFALMPPALTVTAFSGNVDIVGNITLSPSPVGTLDIEAAGSINGLQPTGESVIGSTTLIDWSASTIDLSDANPSSIPGIAFPLGYQSVVGKGNTEEFTGSTFLLSLDALFAETGSTEGAAAVIGTKEALHTPGLLHADDTEPLRLYAVGGDLSGVTLFSPKQASIIVGQDITDIAFYIQNDASNDLSVVSAGKDIIAYDLQSPLRNAADAIGNDLDVQDAPALAGDIQISGPGTLEVLAGHDLTLGLGSENANGTGAGITSIGNARDPYLPFNGADVIAAAGLGSVAIGLDGSSLDFTAFITQFLEGADGTRYFGDLTLTDPALDVSNIDQFDKLSKEEQDIVALDLFYLVLRDAGRDHNLPGSPGYGAYTAGFAAVTDLFLSHAGSGDINLTSREIKTESGGNVSILDPVGLLTVGIDLPGNQPVDQGILTEDGGNISIYTEGSVIVGTSRIFTLRGGNEIIWSSGGNIAAGASAKTVQSAPPTRVLVDPQSGDVETDLAGLATGGGIGVLASVANVPAGSVDLIAPTGVIDAGDAGIRATGNLNLAAVQVLNASNIQAGGASSGVPTVTVAAPNLGALSAASSASGAVTNSETQQANNENQSQTEQSDQPSIINVEVLGYGGGDDDTGA